MATDAQSSTLIIERSESIVTITMNRPERRNSLSLDHLLELTDAFRSVGASDARGIVLAANGPVFSAGHDFAAMAGADLDAMRHLLRTCTDLMLLIQDLP
ncbi:MAG: enoyl-CoA hydratase-related protein, partial [Acidimicrobiales bacterium]